MNTKQLDRIETMLQAILKSQKLLHWISGYVHGRTKGGDPFIVLYPASPKLDEKVCRVYKQGFSKLPDYIDTNIPPTAQRANPSRSEAVQLGIYHECALFQIAIYNGRETQMGPEKRFCGTVRISERHGDQLADELFNYRYGDGTEAVKAAEREAFADYRQAHGGRVPGDVGVLREWFKVRG